MRKGLLSLVFLTLAMLLIPSAIQTSAMIYLPPGGGGGSYCFYPVYTNNDAGYAYDLSGITFVTTLVNLTGTYEFNFSEGYPQEVAYFIALGYFNGEYSTYIQPIMFLEFQNGYWCLEWYVQAWSPNGQNEVTYYGIISVGSGYTANLNYLFNLTIKATLNSQDQVTSAWVYIANAKTG